MATPPKRRPGGSGKGGPSKGGPGKPSPRKGGKGSKPPGRGARTDPPTHAAPPSRQPFAPRADRPTEAPARDEWDDEVVADDEGPAWFAVRCVVHLEFDDLYEERVTLWHSASFDDAVATAEAEAEAYAAAHDGEYLGLAQAFEIEGTPGHGAEVFSLIRECDLSPDAYLDQFFDTGLERQREL